MATTKARAAYTDAGAPARWFAPHEPRAWQAAAWPRVQAALREGGGPMISACTGAGKSILQRSVLGWAMSGDRPGIVVLDVPTQALVEQMYATLEQGEHTRGRAGRFYGRRKQIRSCVVSCRASLGTLAETLLAEGIPVRLMIIDEAHMQPDRVRAFLEAVDPTRRISVTATPYRSAPTETLDIVDRVVVRYTLADALRDGVLVPWTTIPWTGEAAEIDDACSAMIHRHGLPAGPGIVDATDIDDAETYAERLRADGVRASAVHSRMSMADRNTARDCLEAGELDAIVHVSTLVEGVDWPWLQWLCLRRRVGSRVRLVQQVGRGLRTHPGKDRCLILDPHGLTDPDSGIGLVHPEAIGQLEDEIADELEGRPPRPEPGSTIKARDVLWVIGRDPIEAWIADCYTVAASSGVVPTRKAGTGASLFGASMRQRGALADRAAKRCWLPNPLGRVAKQVCVDVASGGDVSRACADQLLTLMGAAGRLAYQQHAETGTWRTAWPAPVPPLPGGYDVER